MITNRTRIESANLCLIIKYFCHNHLGGDVLTVLIGLVGGAVGCVAFGETGRIAKASWIEEGMRFINSGIDVTDLNATSCIRPSARTNPGGACIDDLMALAQNGMIERIVLH